MTVLAAKCIFAEILVYSPNLVESQVAKLVPRLALSLDIQIMSVLVKRRSVHPGSANREEGEEVCNQRDAWGPQRKG